MEILPDDLWHQILKTGTQTNRLDHKDLCSLSMSCHGFNKLTQDSALWGILLNRDFWMSNQSPSKAGYREEFEFSRNCVPPWSLFRDWSFIPELPEISFLSPETPDHFQTFTEWWLLHGDDDIIQASGEEQIGQSSTSQAIRLIPNIKDKFLKHRNKGPKPKVCPNSKSYIPMHKPPHHAMPRKI